MARTGTFQSFGSADRWLDATHCVPACLLACPLVSAGLWSAGLSVWDLLASLAVAATIMLFASLDGIRSTPGEVTEAIGLALSVTAVAIAPSLATGLFKRSWSEMVEEAVNAFPSWLGIMIAPTVVVFAFAADLHPGLIRAQHLQLPRGLLGAGHIGRASELALDPSPRGRGRGQPGRIPGRRLTRRRPAACGHPQKGCSKRPVDRPRSAFLSELWKGRS